VILTKPPDGYSVRLAISDDAADCAIVFAAAQAGAFPDDPPDTRDFAAYTRACTGEEQWVCCLGRDIIGFISVYWEDNFIHSLYIHPSHQKQGAGRALLAAVQALDRGPLELKVDEVNVSARAFYHRLGWREVGDGVGQRGRWLRLRWDGGSGAPAGTVEAVGRGVR
jgi:GNAT superfamily N-acetyltransferase